MADLADRLSGWVGRALLVVGCLFLFLMMVHVSADVIMRHVANQPIMGTLETVSYYYMVFAVFLPLAYVERAGEHIRVDLFVQLMPRWLQLGLYLASCVIALVYFGMLAYQGYLDALRSTERLETIMSNFLFYIWPSRWALPIGFAAVVLAVLANMLKAVAGRRPL